MTISLENKTKWDKWEKYYIGPEIPSLLIRIGPMGSGKTSAIDLFIEKNLGYSKSVFQLINLDDIVTTNLLYKNTLISINDNLSIMPISDQEKKKLKTQQLNKLWSESQNDIQGYKLVDYLILKMINRKRTFSIESTGSYFCPNRKRIINSYKNGYDTMIIFTFLPFYELINRISKRAEEENRDLDLNYLMDNILNAYEKYSEYLYITGNFYILDNFVEKKENPILLLHTKMDFKKYDSENCVSVNSFNDERIQILKNLIMANKTFYTDQDTTKKQKIYEAEIKFLTNIQSIGSQQITPPQTSEALTISSSSSTSNQLTFSRPLSKKYFINYN